MAKLTKTQRAKLHLLLTRRKRQSIQKEAVDPSLKTKKPKGQSEIPKNEEAPVIVKKTSVDIEDAKTKFIQFRHGKHHQAYVLALSEEEIISIYGVFRIAVIQGEILLNGFNMGEHYYFTQFSDLLTALNSESHPLLQDVYSLDKNCCVSLTAKTIKSTNPLLDWISKGNQSVDVPTKEVHEFIQKNQGKSLIVLSGIKKSLSLNFGKKTHHGISSECYITFGTFGNREHDESSSPFCLEFSSKSDPESKSVQSFERDFGNLLTLQCSPSWVKDMNGLKQLFSQGVMRYMIMGKRNTGKTTYAKFLVNNLLSHHPNGVFFLETDLGQNHFSFDGVIELRKITKPILKESPESECVRSYFLGTNSAKTEPWEYVAALDACLKFYTNNHADQPLVINAPGWMTGLGEEINHLIVKMSSIQKITFLMPDAETTGEILSFESYEKSIIFSRLHAFIKDNDDFISGIESEKLHKRKFRLLKNLAGEPSLEFISNRRLCLHNVFAMQQALEQHPSYEFPLQHFEVVFGDNALEIDEHTLFLLNGAVISFCSRELYEWERRGPHHRENGHHLERSMQASTPEFLFLNHGIGIIRDINVMKQKIYIQTQMSPDIFDRIDCLRVYQKTTVSDLFFVGENSFDFINGNPQPYIYSNAAGLGSSSVSRRKHLDRKSTSQF